MKTKKRIGSQTIAGMLLVALVLGALVFAPLASAHEGGIEKGLDADAAGNAGLAANPELMVAQRYSSATAQTADEARLAANPELMVAHRYNLAAAQAAAEARLAANPELISHIRYQTCGC